MFKVKNKYSMTLFWCFYYRLWPQLAYQCIVSTFNFEQVFVSWVWNTSHNVLSKRYVCFVIKVARPISFSDLSLHLLEINYEHMTILWTNYGHIINICFISTFVHRFISLFDLLYCHYFPEIWSFSLYQTKKLFT